MTLGKATPTHPAAPASRPARATSTGMREAGVHGRGVGAEMRAPCTLPLSTSTSPAFTEEPPTSMPSTPPVIPVPPRCARSQISGCGELQVALPAPLAVPHPHRGERDAGRHDEHHDGSERVDVRRHPEAYLGENDHRQCARAWPRDKLRDDQIIP